MSSRRREPEELELPTELAAAIGQLQARSPLCPRTEMLQAAQSGVLPDEVAKDVNKHVEGCRLCQSVIADLEALDRADLDASGQKRIWEQVQAGVSREKSSADASGRGEWWSLWLRPLPLAALGAAVVVLAVGLVFMRDRQQPPVSVAQGHPPALPATPSVFKLEKPAVVLPASADIVWRGQASQSDRQTRELKQALVPYEADNYAEAAQRLTRLHKKHPRMAEASFYLGASQLFLNQNEDAAKTLKDAANLADMPLKFEAAWYLALAEYRIGQRDLAISSLQQLCHAGGEKSARACAGIKEVEAQR